MSRESMGGAAEDDSALDAALDGLGVDSGDAGNDGDAGQDDLKDQQGADGGDSGDQGDQGDQGGDDGADGDSGTPEGYMSYEEWVAAGKDPDMFKGRKAYEMEYDRIQDNKELKQTLKDTQETLRNVQKIAREQQNRALEEQRQELESKFNKQKEDGDVDGAIETGEQIKTLERQAEDVKADDGPQMHPVIQKFIDDSPLLNKSSERFNQDFYDDMALFNNKEVYDMDPDGTGLSERQIQGCMERAFEKAKKLHPQLFTSPRNQRQGPSRQGKTGDQGGKVDYRKELENLHVIGRNKADVNAAVEMYDDLCAMGDAGKKQAEIYAKNVLKGVQA